MPWKLLGTVTNMHLPDLGDVTVPAPQSPHHSALQSQASGGDPTSICVSFHIT